MVMALRTVWRLYGNRRRPCVLGVWRSHASISGNSVLGMAARDGELRAFVVAGEVSGDTIASRLMTALKTLSPFPVRFAGVGGVMMSKQGLKSLFPMEDISVMGIWELMPHLGKIRVKLKETVDAALLFQPHVVVTVDSKGFSFRLLKLLRARHSQQYADGPIHFHYVAPSFWAWKGGQVEWTVSEFCGPPYIRRCLGVESGGTIISLLPGSRLQEVARMLPIFAETVTMLKSSILELLTVIHVAPNQHVEDYIDGFVRKWPVPVILIPGGEAQPKYEALSASRIALCTSGTVAVEMQLARLPCVVAYRAHLLTELFIRYKAKIPYISLPNILLNTSVIPEALFEQCTPGKLTSLLMELIHDEGLREKQALAAPEVMKLLWPSEKLAKGAQRESSGKCLYGSPSMIAASTILDYVKTTSI
ncbi:probable lipid-A-disaccharide synthase, mitochondrial isoform X2 [Rhodamnia argentea]|uniref:lipid-A-disaccharide synthase n=1 Tax=Rhodamnia argentea TaxID=178133 RepID=A0ABM3HLV9_9MYRT|nr:probable lipid-A-disaccharide synthase, mitochondrial isoform X2 [Rhodamnia argentea]